MSELSTQERFKRGAVDAPRYFRFMADFVGFTPADAQTIRETRSVVEKHLPTIIGSSMRSSCAFPATRKPFLKKDGTIDQDYLELRMQHQANFWRRTMTAVFDDDYARFVDYVGRAHTSQGADPRIYISERYVIGMIGFMQQRIAEALAQGTARDQPGSRKPRAEGLERAADGPDRAALARVRGRQRAGDLSTAGRGERGPAARTGRGLLRARERPAEAFRLSPRPGWAGCQHCRRRTEDHRSGRAVHRRVPPAWTGGTP